ncbi:MAG: hypothetical protein JWP87_5403 [Labilithrix sp.]|nr:hypothetical protein [Labilithrix sp.]
MLLMWGCGFTGTGAALPDGGGDADAGVTPDAGTTDTMVAPAPIHAGTALAFNESSRQYIDFPNIPLPADFTIEAWIRPASSGREEMIVAEDKILNPPDQFRLALVATGELYFAMSDQSSNYFGLMDYTKSGTAQFALHSPSPLPTGAWSHVAATKSGADFALLVDGKIMSTFKAASAMFARGTELSFRIGARMGNGGPDGYFDGTIDDVRLYTRARSAAEIASDMKTALVASSPGFADLLSYWRFDEGAGATAHDDKKAFDGTVKGGPTWVPSDAF